ncbi:MAG: CHASE2 domain-containing protein [Rhodospirillaceae bacterium]|nr:CHASE2 domain-containing protein [Rhodospirillaceae bacterium]
MILALVVFVVAAIFQYSRLSEVVDNELMERWFELFPGELSDDLVVVEIDSRSIQALRSWPWPRTFHAEAIRRLTGAGAAAIGVDIDFSSYSTAEADLDLVRAVAQSDRPVIFPVFRQWGWTAPGETGLFESQPFPELAVNSLLAHVNVHPDGDGITRRHATFAELPGTGTLPSMAMALAGTTGAPPSFVLDFAIPIESVRRVSFVDLISGDFDTAAIDGKRVLIGATAIELGDQLSVPVHVTLPGVLIHALAFETLRQGRTLTQAPAAAVLAGTLALALGMVVLLRRLNWRSALLAALGATILVLAAAGAAQALLTLIVPVVPWLLVIALAFVAAALVQIDVLMEQLLRKAMALIHRTSMMNSIVNDTSDGILIADRQGNVTFANPALKSMLGLDEAGIGSRQFARRFADLTGLWHHDPAAGPPGDDAVLSGSAHPAECEIETAAGTRIVVAVRAAYSRLNRNTRRADGEDDQPTGIFTLRDITARKQLEEAQARALEEATGASRAKTNFLANMNHELRTPLNAIIGFSEIMRDQVFGPLGNESYVDYSDSIHESGARLLATVNAVLEAARIDSGAYEIDEDITDLASLIDHVTAALADAAAERSLTVTVSGDADCPRLRCDIDAVRKAIRHIADNAIKFNKNRGSVDIHYGPSHTGGLTVEITDTGIGLSENDIAKILKPFGQADAALNRKFEGSGLGLTIASGLMRLHGGTLDIASTPKIGTTVTLSFPPDRSVPGSGC